MSNIKVDNLINSSGKVVSVDDVSKAVSTNTHINDDSTGSDKLSLQKTKDLVRITNLTSLVGQKGKQWRVSDDESVMELVFMPRHEVGDVLITAATPDATFVKDNGYYPLAAYPALFGVLGYLNADNALSNSTALISSPSANGLTMAYGKDEVLFIGTTSTSENPLFIGRSTDYGATFTKPYSLANSGGAFSFNQIATDSNGVLVAVGAGGLIVRSEDNGANWAKINAPAISGSSTYAISCIATNGSGVWVAGTGTNKYVLVSTDNGKTWTAVNVSYNLTLSTVASNGSGVWVGYSTATSSIVRSTDNGSTWAAVSIGYLSPNGNSAVTATPFAISRIVYSGGCFAFGYGTKYNDSNNNFYYYNACVAYSLNNGVNFTSSLLLSNVSFGGDDGYINLNGIALDKYGTLVVSTSYTKDSNNYSTFYKLTNLNNSRAKALTSANGFASSIATNGVFTWNFYRPGNYGISKADPLYNVKTTFYVPAQPVQQYPYQTYIKAKLS